MNHVSDLHRIQEELRDLGFTFMSVETDNKTLTKLVAFEMEGKKPVPVKEFLFDRYGSLPGKDLI